MSLIKRFSIFVFCIFFLTGFARGEDIKDRFKKNKLYYKVSFNGIPSGSIEWEYLGQEKIGESAADILSISSDTSILKLFDLVSSEKIFLDRKTHLPIKVERNLVVFGKKELIQEKYNQSEGYVKIIKETLEKEEIILRQDVPIHNILALLYFFPADINLSKKTKLYFNLPTRKIEITVMAERKLRVNKERRECYFLVGRGWKKFNLWLDKKSRVPLRLEFVSLLGKVIIRKIEK